MDVLVVGCTVRRFTSFLSFFGHAMEIVHPCLLLSNFAGYQSSNVFPAAELPSCWSHCLS
jgi:hypothetical protein